LLIAANLVTASAFAAAPEFVWRNPTPQGGSLSTVTFAANRFVAGGLGGRVLTSTDGATWHLSASIPNFDITEIAFGGNLWVAVGTGGRILTSPDTVTWTARSSPTTSSLLGVSYAGNQFLACGQNGTLLASPDGTTWTARTSGVTQTLRGVAGRAGAYVAVGDANSLLISPDTITWTQVPLTQPPASFNTVAFLANQFVVIGNLARIYSSPDGVTWTSRGGTTTSGNAYAGVTHDGTQYIIGDVNGPLTFTTNLTTRTAVNPTFNRGINRIALAHGAGVTVVVGNGGEIATSTDGRTWVQRGSDRIVNQLYGAARLDGQWFAVGANWTLFSSPDGTQWTRQTIQNLPAQGTPGFTSIGYGAGRHLAVGDLGFIATSVDGVSWAGSSTASGVTQSLNGVVFTNGRFVAVGDAGVLITSTDGLTWTAATSGVTTNLLAAGALGNTMIAAGASGVILTSTNGTTWTRATSGTTQSLNALCVFANTMYVAGNGRTVLASTNGQTWASRAQPPFQANTGNNYTAIAPANGGLIVAGNAGVALFSTDGGSWSYLPTLAFQSSLAGAASDGVTTVLVGGGGTILQSVDPAAPPSRLVNVATRGLVQPGGALTPGFVLRGTGSKQVVVRAIGPTLSSFGVNGLSDVKLDVVNQQTSAIAATNDDWGGAAPLAARFASLGAFALGATSKDAAVQVNLPVNSGGYSVRITAAGTAASGVALAEVYDGDGDDSPVRVINVSTLGFVGTGENVLTPGLVIRGSAPKKLLIRAVGPGLAPLGVTGLLADPQFSVFPSGSSVAVATSNDWGGTADLKAAFTAAGAFSIPDTSRDAAVVVTLPAGAYTVVTSGVGDTTGTAIVEIYDLDP